MHQIIRKLGAPGATVWLISCVVLLVGCTPSSAPTASDTTGTVLNWANFDEPNDLDPHQGKTPADTAILIALFEGLTSLDPVDLHPVPGVASSWESSPDGLTWTFHLRGDARWSTGDLVTADDFVYSFRRALSARLKSQNAYMLYVLKNAKAYHDKAIASFGEVGARATDDRTLVLTLEYPAPYLPSLVTNSVWFPVPRMTIEKLGASDDPATPWTRPESLVCNGPFTLQQWIPNEIVSLTKSPTYWDAKAVSLERVNFYPLSDKNDSEGAFAANRVQVASQIPVDKHSLYQALQPRVLHETPTLATYLYRFNTTRPPLNDPRVRRALSLAIDRTALTTSVLGGGQFPASSLTPPGMNGFSPPPGSTFQPDEARRLLKEAGFPGGRGLPEIALLYNSNENHRRVADAVSAMWLRELGVHTLQQSVDTARWTSAFVTLDYTVARFGWNGDYADPSTFLDMLASDSPNNATGWRNSAYDAQIALARSSADPRQRNEAFERCEQIVAQEAPVAPLYFYAQSELVKPSVIGWHDNLLDYHPLKGLSLSTRER